MFNTIKKLHSIISFGMINLIALATLFAVSVPAYAQYSDTGMSGGFSQNNSLAQLLVLEGLFGRNGMGNNSLARLITLEGLFGNNNILNLSGNSSNSSSNSNLAQLITLEALFNNNNNSVFNVNGLGNNGLARLIILENLFNGNMSSSSGSRTSTMAKNLNTVSIQNNSFNPSTMTVPVGTTVTWGNLDSATHTVTSDNGSELNSGDMRSGAIYSHTFNQKGTFRYHCTIHPEMNGTIVVQ